MGNSDASAATGGNGVTSKQSKSVERSLKTDELPAAPLPASEVQTRTKASSSTMSDDELRAFDYLDTAQNACLLCQRKLKSLDVLRRHEKESALHEDNLRNLDTCRAGVDRKLSQDAGLETSSQSSASAGFAPIGAAKDASGTPASKYRDRALERRAVFGTDSTPAFKKASFQAKSYEGPVATDVPKSDEPEMPVEKEIDSSNIGSKMLAMMGWSKGQGLGASGQGRTGIVETKIYAKGAGLGSATPSQTQPVPGAGHKAYVSAAKDGE
ncbi:uncharacterized protein PSFLO_01919 [Pseudozyma flocculosa]|uniref:G-patch domain-containing protein n=1 Tax=Pseudozyma flocculosa TaxID=84751 RepID=A0A5C3EW51_9BASI|nr:uncharacterized protein PSFLO_01919 [Pseudozyma flocculosa]